MGTLVLLLYVFWLPLAFFVGTLSSTSYLMYRGGFRPLRIALLTSLLGAVLVVVPAMFNFLANVKVYMAKEGRVIDADTGKGISNVVVNIFAEYGSAEPFSGDGGGELFRYDTLLTDENGYYTLLAQWHAMNYDWSSIFFAVAARRESYAYVVAFRWGYVNVNDKYEGASLNASGPESAFNGGPESWPRVTSPHSTWLGVVVKVDEIKLKKKLLDIKTASLYYAELEHHASPSSSAGRKFIFEEILRQVCDQADQAKTMGYLEFSSFARIAPNYKFYMDEMGHLEPQNIRKSFSGNWIADDRARQYQTNDVCESLKAARGAS